MTDNTLAMQELAIDTVEVSDLIGGFLRAEAEKTGKKRFVVGLSGGIDSATSACLAERALGKDGVVAVLMPHHTSSASSLEDAQRVVDMLGVESVLLDISPMVDGYFDKLPDADKLRRGNVMARARMIVLYDQSEICDALVLGTGNKTEHLLGYTTLWGDMACAVNPLGDLYKTQVRQLAVTLGVPESIVNKPPSADLWDGQTDEEELGFAYAEVDRLLHYMIDEGCDQQKLEEIGFSGSFIERVRRRIRATEFKRRMPLVARFNGS